MDVTMKKVVEASYLTVDSASYYRTILRYCYHQHERMRDFITPEEILEHLRTVPSFFDYEDEQLHLHLAQLVKWNNLTARQDMTNAKTIEEYKKKRFRYQPTPYTIEIERMLITLEKNVGDTFQGSLERSQFEKLLQALNNLHHELEYDLTKAPDVYMGLWEDIFRYFQTIRTSTADYIAYINSEQTNQRMQTEAFLVYKSQFTTYLRDFIVSLQKTSLQISGRLKEMPLGKLNHFFQKLVEHRRSIPRMEDNNLSLEEQLVEFQEYWSSLTKWFIGTGTQQSELDILQIQTNEMIRRMTRYVQRIGERQQHFRSRKNDYLHLAKWFSNCFDLDEAHKISSVVFGAMTIQHLQFDRDTTENLHLDTWDEPPVQVTIKPRTNRYREKTKPNAMISNWEKKQRQRELYIEQHRKELMLIDKYMVNGKIQLSTLSTVEPFMRKLLLSWIAKSIGTKDHIVKTDYGMVVKVEIEKEKMVVLEAEDGRLTMPDATFTVINPGGDN